MNLSLVQNWPKDRNLKVAVILMTLKSQKEEEKRGNR